MDLWSWSTCFALAFSFDPGSIATEQYSFAGKTVALINGRLTLSRARNGSIGKKCNCVHPVPSQRAPFVNSTVIQFRLPEGMRTALHVDGMGWHFINHAPDLKLDTGTSAEGLDWGTMQSAWKGLPESEIWTRDHLADSCRDLTWLHCVGYWHNSHQSILRWEGGGGESKLFDQSAFFLFSVFFLDFRD